MHVLVGQDVMKKKQEQKKEYFLFGMHLANGIQNNNDPNYSICSMDGSA